MYYIFNNGNTFLKSILFFTGCPDSFTQKKFLLGQHAKIDQQPDILIELDDGYSVKDCELTCYDRGCSYLSYVYEPVYDQDSNRLHLAPKKCKLYNGTVTVQASDERTNEIVCESNFQGTNFYNLMQRSHLLY